MVNQNWRHKYNSLKKDVLIVALRLVIYIGPCESRRKRKARERSNAVHFHKITGPHPPLAARPRTLTLPLALEDSRCMGECLQRTLDQSQSFFVSKLPLELRQRVYEYSLGHCYVHLQHGAFYWKALGRTCTLNPCVHENLSSREESTMDVGLPLLKTCRQLYVKHLLNLGWTGRC